MQIIKVDKNNLFFATEAAELFCWNSNPKHSKDVNRNINEQFFERDNNIMYVAVNGSKVVGSIYGYVLDRFETDKKQLFIYAIDVLEEYRRQGIGKKLIKAFITNLKSGKYHNAFVITNKENYSAVNLYKSTGAKQAITNDGDAILFKWV